MRLTGMRLPLETIADHLDKPLFANEEPEISNKMSEEVLAEENQKPGPMLFEATDEGALLWDALVAKFSEAAPGTDGVDE